METRVLANEAYLKLFGKEDRDYADRGHFFRLVSRAVRQVLVDYAESQRALKRGGGGEPLTLSGNVARVELPPDVAEEVLGLDEALERFRRIDPRATEIVELRFFAGLTNKEIAETMGISLATVGRDWTVARAWLKRGLRQGWD